MFDMDDNMLDYFIRTIDEDGSRQVHIGMLFSYLYPFINNLNIVQINKKTQSTWAEKKKLLNR